MANASLPKSSQKPKDSCCMDACDMDLYCRKMCRMHYKRWQRTGHPEHRHYKDFDPYAAAEKRFWNSVTKGLSSGVCWEWGGYRNESGYGSFYVDGKLQLTHRYSYFLHNGIWEPYLRHSCDNPPCCNPAHLLPGTHAQNMKEAGERGLMMHGEAHVRAKLTVDLVREIRSIPEPRPSYLTLGMRYGVSWSVIRNVIIRKTWKSVT